MKGDSVYEDLTDFKALKTFMEDQLENYNMGLGVIAMDLVLFKDAIEHGNNTCYIYCTSLTNLIFKIFTLGYNSVNR